MPVRRSIEAWRPSFKGVRHFEGRGVRISLRAERIKASSFADSYGFARFGDYLGPAQTGSDPGLTPLVRAQIDPDGGSAPLGSEPSFWYEAKL